MASPLGASSLSKRSWFTMILRTPMYQPCQKWLGSLNRSSRPSLLGESYSRKAPASDKEPYRSTEPPTRKSALGLPISACTRATASPPPREMYSISIPVSALNWSAMAMVLSSFRAEYTTSLPPEAGVGSVLPLEAGWLLPLSFGAEVSPEVPEPPPQAARDRIISSARERLKNFFMIHLLFVDPILLE